MKCPILTLLNMPAERSKGILGVDCLKEECAVWDTITGRCGELVKAENLRLISGALIKIEMKMPHEAQFRK